MTARLSSRATCSLPQPGNAMGDFDDWIGRETVTTAYLGVDQANKMAVTLNRQPSFAEGDALPPAWHWLYFHDLVLASDLGADGHPQLGLVMPPVPLPRRMWAAGKLDFLEALPLGSTAERTSTIIDITAKTGRTGSLYFVAVEHVVRLGLRECVREQQTIVYRELEAGSRAEPAPEERPVADFSAECTANSTTLFRYSALTFNGHRIHYDVDYARDIEGYPGLVIHGPLIATLLVDLAAQQAPVRHFEFRAKSPLFAPGSFVVSGRREGADGAALWAAAPDGRIAMEASATYM
jgi:3-methylfumaryl-CoA hydratase